MGGPADVSRMERASLFLGERKWDAQVLLAHPALVLSLPRGKMEVARRHIAEDLARVRNGRKSCFHNSYLYRLVRDIRPETVVETGVESGSSSAFILQALSDNGRGHLYSIDLPDPEFVGGDPSLIGFVVPEALKVRWTLVLGDARIELPKLLLRLGPVDIFHHDSLHTYEHMTFEYELAWPRIRGGGLLASDDVFRNSALADFCGKRKLVYQRRGQFEAVVVKPTDGRAA